MNVAGEMLHFGERVNIKLQTKIRYNGQEYSGPDQLPPDVRAAYDQAIVNGPARQKVVINGQEFANQSDMPADVRKLYDDVLSVIENNGEVTLPTADKREALLTRRELLLVILFALGLVSLILARIAG